MERMDMYCLPALAMALAATMACDGEVVSMDDSFRAGAPMPDDPADAPGGGGVGVEVGCTNFDGECINRFTAGDVINVDAEGATLLWTEPCLDANEDAVDGCIDLEMTLSNGDTAVYTMVDASCTGTAKRMIPKPGGFFGKPKGKMPIFYNDPACFGGYIALKRSRIRSVTRVETDNYNFLGIPARVDRNMRTTIEVQTPDHWIDHVGNVGHQRYGGMVLPEGGPWQNPPSTHPDSGWHTVLTIESLDYNALNYGTVCESYWLSLTDHEGESEELLSPVVQCAYSSVPPVNPYQERCRLAVNEKYPAEDGLLYIAATTVIAACEGQFSTSTVSEAGGGLGGSISGDLGVAEAEANAKVEGRVENSSSYSGGKNGCAEPASLFRSYKVGKYAAELEACLNNPSEYFHEEPTVTIVIGEKSQGALSIGDGEDGVFLSTCHLENGATDTFTTCATVGDEHCCTSVRAKNKNCAETVSGDCQCEQGEVVSEEEIVCAVVED